MLRIHRIPDFTPKLLLVRKRLLGLEPEGITYVPPCGSALFIFRGDFGDVLTFLLSLPLVSTT